MAAHQLQEVVGAFKRLTRNDSIEDFVDQFGFVRSSTLRAQQYLEASLAVGEDELVVSSRWFDPSGPFANAPDVNRIELFVSGHLVASFDFPDD